MSTWLFTPPAQPYTTRSLIAWWEQRRLFYNLFIGSIGLCSLLAFRFFIGQAKALSPGEDAFEPLALVFAPVLLNIGYTTGWVIEVLALHTGRKHRYLRGPFLLRIGLAFSLLMVLTPSVIWGLAWLIGLLFFQH